VVDNSPIVEHSVATWDGFRHELLGIFGSNGHRFTPRQFVFRGQADANWALRSSFERLFGELNPVEKDRRYTELIGTFHELCQAEGLVSTNGEPDYELHALGQHHGLPTSLLDWSESPYIAAFFAMAESLISRASGGERAAIFALQRNSQLWRSGPHCVEFIDRRPRWDKLNDRLKRQRGCFTLSRSKESTLEDYIIENWNATDGVVLHKFSFPVTEAAMAIAELEAMGISYLSLFAGFEAAAKEAQLRTTLDARHALSMTNGRGPR
jgi:hypothetical protein